MNTHARLVYFRGHWLPKWSCEGVILCRTPWNRMLVDPTVDSGSNPSVRFRLHSGSTDCPARPAKPPTFHHLAGLIRPNNFLESTGNADKINTGQMFPMNCQQPSEPPCSATPLPYPQFQHNPGTHNINSKNPPSSSSYSQLSLRKRPLHLPQL